MISKATAKRAFQLIVLALVIWGIAHTARNASRDLQEQRDRLLRDAAELEQRAQAEQDHARRQELERRAASLRRAAVQFWQADLWRLTAAAVLYACGLVPAAVFWRKCLRSVGHNIPFVDVWWAYVYGGLGKYFPGKAMVIVMRVAELAPFQVRKTAATVTVFMETLTIMAVGGVVAGVGLILLEIDLRWSLLAAGLALATSAPTHPWILQWLLSRLQRGVEPSTMQRWQQQVSWRLMATGWGLCALTWLMWGLSLGFVLTSLPLSETQHVPAWRLWLSAEAAAALAVVLGFVSLVPGGAGVRELVLSVVLTPVIGSLSALTCAVWTRIVWLAAELGVVAVTAALRKLVGRRKPL